MQVTIMSGWALFALMSVWMIYFVPMNMDEALPYHVLACVDHPNYAWQTFIEGCDNRYSLTTPWGFTYPRPYGYVGLFDSLLYAPVYYLFHSPVAQLWFGAALFVLFCFWMSRLTKNPSLSLPFFLCFFPVLYQFIHDTGPIKVSALAFPLSAMMYVKACRSGRVMQVLLGFLQAVLLLLATEEKIFFLYLIPAIGLFSMAIAQARPDERISGKASRIGWIYILAALTLFVPGLILYLLSTFADGQAYLAALKGMSIKYDMRFIMNKVAYYGLYWPSFAHRNYSSKHWPLRVPFEIGTFIFMAACFFIGRPRKNTERNPRYRSLLLGASFLSMLILFLATQNAWAGHHYVYMWIPLMVLFGDLLADLDKKSATRLAAVFLALNLLAAAAVAHMTPEAFSSSDRDRIAGYFNQDDRPEQAMLNVSGWGIYYPLSLYARKDSLITNAERLDDTTTSQLLEIARKTNRTLYETCFEWDCTEPMLEKLYGEKVRFEEQNLGLARWHVFKAVSK